MKKSFAVLFILISSYCFGQKTKLDSLKIQYEIEKNIMNRRNILAKICYTYKLLNENEQRLFYAKKLLHESIKLNDASFIGRSYIELAYCYFNLKISDKAIFYFTKTDSISSVYDIPFIKCKALLGLSSYYKSDLVKPSQDSVLKYREKALLVAKKYNINFMKVRIYNILSNEYINSNPYNAITYIDSSANIIKHNKPYFINKHPDIYFFTYRYYFETHLSSQSLNENEIKYINDELQIVKKDFYKQNINMHKAAFIKIQAQVYFLLNNKIKAKNELKKIIDSNNSNEDVYNKYLTMYKYENKPPKEKLLIAFKALKYAFNDYSKYNIKGKIAEQFYLLNNKDSAYYYLMPSLNWFALHPKNNYKSLYKLYLLKSKIEELENHYKLAYESSNISFKYLDSLSINRYSTLNSFISKQNTNNNLEKIENLSSQNKMFEKKISTLFPIISALSLMIFITFIFYKKKVKKFEKAKSKEIESLKNIVIKNHIILKDKTKIYISDLIYIKSDDHYLNVFLNSGKNHFVRGKLIQIIKELPPNFVRCHRSYIVNSNFIMQVNGDFLTLEDNTQIPISRSYKDKF